MGTISIEVVPTAEFPLVESFETGSVDGLLIYDSLAGPALAERMDATVGWQEFTLFRATGPATEVRVTFVLSGLGEAWIDDVTIELHVPRRDGQRR